MRTVVVREYAWLTTEALPEPALDRATIPAAAFDWLCREAPRYRSGGASLVQMESRRWLRLANHVGVIEAPDGTRIEILPKHTSESTTAGAARRVLYRMLGECLNLTSRDAGLTALQTFKTPVSEWIIQQFLAALDELVRKGLRFGYRPVEESLRFLRGRLLVTWQIRQPPARQHLFQVEHQIFDANRPANRLIRSALEKAAAMTRDAGNWRLAHKLDHQLASIDPSADVPGDFRRWRDDRLMRHYRVLRPWCELILGDRNPLSTLGTWYGRSLLFPMEKVFERFVEVCLRRNLPHAARVRSQVCSESLCHTETGKSFFVLRPDFLIEHAGQTWVVDAKWKLLDAGDASNNHGIAQADFYQLFAYGQRYLGGEGKLVLMYPRTERFRSPLGPFWFDGKLSLDVVPLDLDRRDWHGSNLPCAGAATTDPVTDMTLEV